VKIRTFLTAAVLMLCGVAYTHAQPAPNAFVVVSCPPSAGYTAGQTRFITVDLNGNLCATGSFTATQGTYTPLSPMQSGLTVASSTALTIPATANYAVVCAYGQAVNYTTDGTTTPTTTASGVGMQLAVGSCVPLVGATVIANFRAIQQSATATLSVSYFKQ
jgi:hypothetical protein